MPRTLCCTKKSLKPSLEGMNRYAEHYYSLNELSFLFFLLLFSLLRFEFTHEWQDFFTEVFHFFNKVQEA